MGLHSSVNSTIGKKLWNILRIAFFMMRKGLTSKRKLLMDMNLMMKRGKILRKSLRNLMSHHHHSHHHSKNGNYSDGDLHHYEFSCTNSPNPYAFHMSKRKHKHDYFSCIRLPNEEREEEEEEKEEEETPPHKAVVMMPKVENSPECYYNFQFSSPDVIASGEKSSPLKSPFSVRVSNYSMLEDENDDDTSTQVDHDAEDFIRRFYEQLRVQSRTQLLQYQEMQYQEMIARGSQ